MYTDKLKFLVRFNNPSYIYEEVSKSCMSVEGNDTSIQVLNNNEGYVMKNNQYIIGDGVADYGYITSLSSAFTIGFWLYPTLSNIIIDENNDIQSMYLPLFDFEYNSDSVLNIQEETTEQSGNHLRISFNNCTYVVTTENYTINQWHNIWISYNGIVLEVYIDGILQNIVTSGTIPSNISGNILNLYINHSRNGYSDRIAKNIAYVSDLFILNTFDNSIEKIKNNINCGIDYVIDYDYINKNIDSYGICFDDISVLTVSSIAKDAGCVYAGRNDGKILKGSSLLWELRKNYSDINENDTIELKEEDKIENGYLKIKKSSINL